MARTPIHPGEILAEQLGELGMSVRQFASEIDVPANRISQLLRGSRAVTADTALRLGHYFRTDPRFWLNLQQSYELRLAQNRAAKRIARLPRLKRAAVPVKAA
jgi:addiction module HigA family antidote